MLWKVSHADAPSVSFAATSPVNGGGQWGVIPAEAIAESGDPFAHMRHKVQDRLTPSGMTALGCRSFGIALDMGSETPQACDDGLRAIWTGQIPSFAAPVRQISNGNLALRQQTASQLPSTSRIKANFQTHPLNQGWWVV